MKRFSICVNSLLWDTSWSDTTPHGASHHGTCLLSWREARLSVWRVGTCLFLCWWWQWGIPDKFRELRTTDDNILYELAKMDQRLSLL